MTLTEIRRLIDNKIELSAPLRRPRLTTNLAETIHQRGIVPRFGMDNPNRRLDFTEGWPTSWIPTRFIPAGRATFAKVMEAISE